MTDQTLRERAEALRQSIIDKIQCSDPYEELWYDEEELDALILSALRAVREECAKEAEKYEDACLLGEIQHGSRAATKHGRAAARAIAQAIREER